MFKLTSIIILLSVISTLAQSNKEEKMNNIYKYSVKDIKGNIISLKEFNGKVLLIVNVASKCGYTKQYKGLQELYSKYKNDGFEVLGFPCNDFGNQEPGTNEQIAEFCEMNFGVTFPMFDKVKVLGENKNDLYAKLTDNSVTGKEEIKWNFEKFLIDKNGNIVKKYKSGVEPLSKELVEDLEKLLKN
ncbi:MAG TPA: glutathione peroxidase [Melioribacteraceae bacterium]|nr:glutathione peroxidase [Melioribacteraceae bacterium]